MIIAGILGYDGHADNGEDDGDQHEPEDSGERESSSRADTDVL
jgi:hypothetical protein